MGGGGGGGSRWSAEPRGAIGGTDRRSESAWAVVGDEAEAGVETMPECLSRGRRGIVVVIFLPFFFSTPPFGFGLQTGGRDLNRGTPIMD